jgi:hypothetical protein
MPFPEELQDGLWHTTTPDRYERIVQSGSIRPEPEIPDSERWKTSRGPDYYPYVRTLGGVSLFDFRGFDPEVYSKTHPMSAWAEFVPCRRSVGTAVWIEIARSKVSRDLVGADALAERWKQENAFAHTIMPRIEAAHIGPIPVASVCRVLRFVAADRRFEELPLPTSIFQP